MYKVFLFFILLLGTAVPSETNSSVVSGFMSYAETEAAYMDLDISEVVDYNAFSQAWNGYNNIGLKEKNILIIIDFTKPSTQERMCVVDVKSRKLLYTTHVSHGKNSGGNYATSFSNVSGSNKSSLGFYLTENTYYGKNGYSLVLNGLEKGVNDMAKERAIVVHGADYSNPSVIKQMGRLGRSLGCPALPQAVSREIIDIIKGGAVLFIYAGDNDYLAQSSVLSPVIRTASL